MALYPCARVSLNTQHKTTHKGFKKLFNLVNENF